MRREIISKILMKNAEHHQTLNKDQHGGSNGKCTTDIA